MTDAGVICPLQQYISSCPQLLLPIAEEATYDSHLDHSHSDKDPTHEQRPPEDTGIVAFNRVPVARLSCLEERLLYYYLTKVSAY